MNSAPLKLRWTHLTLIVLCAAMAFGGSFTCSTSSGDDDDDPPATLPA